jgi:thioredoxin-dependent peroxiredoxin
VEWLFAVVAVIAVGVLLWKLAGAGSTPEVGKAAPGFSLPDQDGKTHTLDNFRGKWLALYFYPRDETPGCVQQACRFRDDWRTLDGMGAEVVGVSVDDVRSHREFAKRHSLMFRLLADTTGAVAARYGSVYNLGPIKLAKRNTFLIDPQGRIAKVYARARPSKNSQEVIGDLRKMQPPMNADERR